MKKILKIGLLVILLLTGFLSHSQTMYCKQWNVSCGGGRSAGYAFECAGSIEELAGNCIELTRAVCEESY